MRPIGYMFMGLPLLAGCGGGGPAADNGQGATTPSDTTAAVWSGEPVDLAAYDLPLHVLVPDAQTAQADSVRIQWNEDGGWLEVGRGPHFDLRITEQPGDIARLKADLDRDQVHRNTVVSEGPGTLIYRQEFPADASLVFLHFLSTVKAGGREFTVESAPEGRFNEQDVRRMAVAVTPSGPA